MIAANELRIGNWVIAPPSFMNRDNHFMQIDGINRNVKEFNLNPIPLTPEILEKSGFDSVNGIYWTQFRVSLDQQENDKEYWGVSLYHGQIDLPRKVKYLHEVQNLIFALTGNELEINL